MFVNGSERNDQSQQRTFHKCFLQSSDTFGQTISEKNLKSAKSETRIACGLSAMFVNGPGRNEQSL